MKGKIKLLLLVLIWVIQLWAYFYIGFALDVFSYNAKWYTAPYVITTLVMFICYAIFLISVIDKIVTEFEKRKKIK